jgi:hypothetical protein
MFNRSDLALAAVLAATVAGVLLLPDGALAGKVDAPPSAVPPPERQAATDDGTYQLRCWQYGRLLFEERALQLSTDTVEGLKLSGTDRRRQPVMVTDTGNATCLIRKAGAPRKPYP